MDRDGTHKSHDKKRNVGGKDILRRPLGDLGRCNPPSLALDIPYFWYDFCIEHFCRSNEKMK